MTTRTLVLVRHAKAEAHGTADVDRALAPRGLVDAAAVGKWLAARQIRPDAVVVSPARRARQTWALAAVELPSMPEPILDARIYENSVEDLLAVIQDTADDVTTLVLVGHNPSMQALAANLDGGTGDPEARHVVSRDFPTSAVAVIDTEHTWADVTIETGRLVAVGVPRGESKV